MAEAGTEAAPPAFEAAGPGLAAILLVALGESDAEKVLQHIEPEEVQSIGEAINSMPPISQTAIAGTLEKFAVDIKDQSSLGVGGGAFFQQLLVKALGREKAGSVLSRLDQHNKPVGVESLKWMPATAIAKIVASEHPQVTAAVLSCLQRSHAAEVLQLLPEDVQADVLLR
ncbi:MAG: flagellar motor switch protein FliG, partial [Pseudomonadota bacterium]